MAIAKKIIPPLMVLALVIGFITMAVIKQKDKIIEEKKQQAEMEAALLENRKSSDIGIYVYGSTLFNASGEEINKSYKFDDNKNIVNTAGEVVVKAENVESFTCATSVEYDRNNLRASLATESDEDGTVTIKPTKFLLKLIVKPENAVNKTITLESKAKALYFPADENDAILTNNETTSARKDLDKITVKPDEKGNVTISVVGVDQGHANVIITNVIGEKIETMDFILTANIPEQDEDSGKTSSQSNSETNQTANEKTSSKGNTAADSPAGNIPVNSRSNSAQTVDTSSQTQTHTHIWRKVASVPASYTDVGSVTYECAVCHEQKMEYKPALTCKHYIWSNTVFEPTCTDDGYTLHECMICKNPDANYTDNIVPALGHEWDEGTIVVQADCTHGGIIHHRCLHEGCTEEMEEDVPALEHTWDEGVLVTPSTCAIAGLRTFTCQECGSTETREEPMADHTMVDEVVDPTYTSEGYTRHYCLECGYETLHTDFTDPLSHDHHFEPVYVAASCTEEGYSGRICTYCQELNVEETFPATGHHYVMTKVQASDIYGGYIQHICYGCNSSYTTHGTLPVIVLSETETPEITVDSVTAYGVQWLVYNNEIVSENANQLACEYSISNKTMPEAANSLIQSLCLDMVITAYAQCQSSPNSYPVFNCVCSEANGEIVIRCYYGIVEA